MKQHFSFTNILSIVFVSILLAGCATAYNDRLTATRDQLSTGNYTKAITELKKTDLSTESANELLYNLEAGLLYHLAGDYKKSNEYLENSEWIAEELFTRSASRDAASMLSSDNIIPYKGEKYEYLYTNYYKLLNYLYLGMFDDAMVEVRRLTYKLSLFEIKNPFLSYIAAILYQMDGENSDAFIEYKKSYDAYSRNYAGINYPYQLSKDISVFAKESRFSRTNEFPKKVLSTYQAPEDYGTAVIILETGLVPNKTEESIEVSIPDHYRKKYPNEFKDRYYMSVALPAYTELPDTVVRANVNLNGEEHSMYLMDDIEKIAKTVLKNELPQITSKAIARAVSKYIAYKKVKGQETDDKSKNLLKSILGATVNAIGVVSEVADTRSWLTLPNRIYAVRLYLKPGDYDLKLNTKSFSGKTQSFQTGKFTIKAGENKFISVRSN